VIKGSGRFGFFRGIFKRQLYTLCSLDGEDTIITAERQEFYHPDERISISILKISG
jgi:hypothetical protein